MSTIAELRQKKKELAKQMQDAAKEYFNEHSKAIFDKWPKLEWFAWTQYTPHFNDGDTCRFGANIDYPSACYEGKEYDELEYTPEETEPNYKDLQKLNKEIVKFLKAIDEDDYETMFGDHVKVVVSRKGADVDEYEHD
jgi:hypothetical protein